MDDGPGPLRGAVGRGGDVAVAEGAAGQQDNARVAAVDGVGSLALGPVEVFLFAGPQGTYFNLVLSMCVGFGGSPRGHFSMQLPRSRCKARVSNCFWGET